MSLEINKSNAIAFYKMAYEGNPKEAIAKYVGKQYIQHNPDVADGTAGFIDYFERMQIEYPQKSIEFVRAIAQDDLVALHTHQIWPDDDQYVTMDFLDLIRKVRYVSIGTLFNRSLKRLLILILCINTFSFNELIILENIFKLKSPDQ
ncbi:possible membrane protein [Nonlabens ulvanivorans]|uniref:Possible membrane protein n=1 Tax=Nonlabens ulvanivorans TaxID=906888 RepID=A0A090R1J6_NONUL|nr:possible membrane protein [Nonlabens ulvanivorans]